MNKFRYIILSKKTCICAFMLAFSLVLGVYSVVNWDKTLTTASSDKKLPIYCVNTPDKKVSLSFDAAWGNEDTGTLIEILGKYNIKATFFVVGEWVDKYPESVKQLSDAGHEIMNHSNTHPHMSQLSIEQISEQISSCNDKIEKITGRRPILHRAPYGEYCNSLIDVLSSMNMYCVQWDVDSLDWKDYDADRIYNKVTSSVKSGSICLFHNAAKHTPEALPRIIEKLQADGYEIVPISKLIYKNNYTIDYKGEQIPNTGEGLSATSIQSSSTSLTKQK